MLYEPQIPWNFKNVYDVREIVTIFQLLSFTFVALFVQDYFFLFTKKGVLDADHFLLACDWITTYECSSIL